MGLDLTLPTERTSVAPGRIVQLDGLRAVAIGCVFAQHLLHVPFGWIGVDIFFVLSGFLITGILLERKRKNTSYFGYFYRRRCFRILPSYCVSLVIFGLLFGWNTFKPWPLFALFAMNWQVVILPRVVLTPLPVWSLAVEEQFYLIWPILILLVSEKWLLRIAIAVLIMDPLLRAFYTPQFPSLFFIYMLTPFRADCLCAGAVLTIVWQRRSQLLVRNLQRYSWLGVIGGFGCLAVLQFWPIFRLASNSRWSNSIDYSLSIAGSASLVLWTLADGSWWRRFLSSKPMRYLGEISYTMYLVHIIVLYLLERRIHSEPLQAILTIVFTILWASASWFLMERPAIRFGARAHAAA